jgi:hypothetical protein
MKKYILIGAVLIVMAGIFAWSQISKTTPKLVTNFEECAASGNPVMESYPRQCRADGTNYVENIATTSTETVTSGVQGRVTLGPTCPVERIPPDPNCAPKPYRTTVQVIEMYQAKNSPFTTTETDGNGNYKVALPPGKYALQPVGGSTLPRCETKEIEIKAGQLLTADLSCDTGIR